MTGRFFVVATPIGNLGDLTLRGQEVLSEAAVILAEDTRHSQKLLRGLSIAFEEKQLISCHQHNELDRLNLVLDALAEGKCVALVSDAGTPTLSDPGGRLIEKLIHQGIKIEVCPGASALLAALMGAGLNTTRFAFLGFLPKKGKERETRITSALVAGLSVAFYEAPERIEKTLQDLNQWVGPIKVVVARELTKKFETFHRGVLGSELAPPLVLKGEMVVVLEAPQAPAQAWLMGLSEEAQQEATRARVTALAADSSLSPKAAAKELMVATGWSRKEAYDAIVAARKDEGET
ncbi:MAG: 16S rRNA (cytidine(1402)-2'-O)-methyltransferase [Myxococcales bacterium]|nr:16S rRNA (cytidine(1402)-2'-O)-methyltransferase [Myxococcales bacterium]